MPPRKKTRQVNIGNVRLGGDAPVVLQTMTSGYTYEIDTCLAEIHKLAAAGADVVRVAVPDERDTAALREIIPASPVPIVADVHFHFQRALEAIEAGVHKIRLNPGNIQDRPKVERIIAACKERGIPIRVGVNEGGIVERRDKSQRAAEKATLEQDYRNNLIQIMLDKLAAYLRIFEEQDFHDVVISAKSIDPRLVIDVYTAISARWDFPLHLGVTHAGTPDTGRIRSIAALGTLLANGIGDTIRISYAADPVYEVEDGAELLCTLGLRPRKTPELIACPTCGRIEVDLLKLVEDVKQTILKEIDIPLKIAVMGCVVNGPGECEGADVAIFGGKGRGIIYVQGEQKQTVAEDRMIPALLEECRAFALKVKNGEATLKNQFVDIVPPDPLPRPDGTMSLPVAR
ncbi:MAG: flavodoxin-dependent (E)-4-hydroxy-3-methylbut-2-enyl-diphosphate synthase [Phycisphaerales bacterium]|nr:flavodoxin-dependent (E)-4-hydroxy-3-methylbut-2-enyl-diphosphate synthase [Phycisphaerales bacterium]